jgi:hypothetical protein
MKRPPIVTAGTIANLIRQKHITRDGQPNEWPVTCRTCAASIRKGEGRRWHTLPYRYFYLCPKCDERWHAEAQALLAGNDE